MRAPEDDHRKLPRDDHRNVPLLSDARTRAALSRYRRRAMLLGGAGIVVSLGVLTLVALTPLSFPAGDATSAGDRAVAYVLGFVAVTTLAGLLSWHRAGRMTRLLRTNPWVSRRFCVSLDPLGNRRPALVLLEDAGTCEAVLVVSALRWRVGELRKRDGDEILAAGNPSKVVVLKLPDSDALFLARRPVVTWWRNKMRAAVMRDDASSG